MKNEEKNQLAAQAEALIAQMSIKFRVQFIESMNLKYSKNFDEAIKSDKYDEIASKIIELMPEANCIPVGYYSCYHTTCTFTPGLEDSLDTLQYWISNEEDCVANYCCPYFKDDMTKRTWNILYSLMEEFIEETLLTEGTSECDNTEWGWAEVMIYDFKDKQFKTIYKD